MEDDLCANDVCETLPGFMDAKREDGLGRYLNSMWAICISGGEDSIIPWFNGRELKGEEIKVGKKVEKGDTFGFIIDFDKRLAHIVYNGKVAKKAFTKIPDEIIPVFSDGGGMKVSIRFLGGKRRF